MALRELIVDLDSYFASVEQQMQPKLRGKPVAVLPVLSDSTCCIAASKEAKKLGIKTGTPVKEARLRCPELQMVEARPALYVQIHQEFLTAIDACLPVFEVLSIDEVHCHLNPKSSSFGEVEKISQDIKSTIRQRIGPYITCTIGAAPNRFLAKLASDMYKPDGFGALDKDDLPGKLYDLKLRDFSGVGHQMEKRLHQHGIFTVKDLTSASRNTMHAAWGSIQGIHMWHWLRGETTVPPQTQKRVVGHSHVLPPHLRCESGVHSVGHRLLQKAAMRLRKMSYFTAGLEVFIKYKNRETWRQEMRFVETQDTLTLLRAYEQIWQQRPHNSEFIPCATGITLSHLQAADKVTADLFTQQPERTKLNEATDLLNKRYGINKVTFAGAMGSLDYSPMRIAFTRIPDAEIEHAEKD